MSTREEWYCRSPWRKMGRKWPIEPIKFLGWGGRIRIKKMPQGSSVMLVIIVSVEVI